MGRPELERPFLPRALLVRGVLLASTIAAPAAADPCATRAGESPCLDADALRVPPARSRFASIAPAAAEPPGTVTAGIDATYLSSPVLLSAPSPDPAGKILHVVDDVLDATLSAAWSPVPHLEVSASLPVTLYRTGSGLVGVTSQRGREIPKTVLRDARLGAGYDVIRAPEHAAVDYRAMARLDLSLPTGDETSFAGERGVELSPRAAGSASYGRFFFGTEQGLRLRRTVELGGRAVGTQIVSSFGIGASIVDAHFDVALEGWVAPTVSQPLPRYADGARVTSATLVPAEWLATARIQLGGLSLMVGGGTAIPLSTETRRDAEGHATADTFAGVTSPRVRAMLVARYAFTATDR